VIAALLLALQATPVAPVPAAGPAPVRATAARVTRVLARQPVIDGHNDLPWEIANRHKGRVEVLAQDGARLGFPLQTDLARLKAGGVGGQFWSVWIPAATPGPRAVELTLEQIDVVHRMVAAFPDRLAFAVTAADVRRIQKSGRIASLIGVEGGHQIDGRLSVLRQYRALGAAYLTLTHTRSLAWADSSTDAAISGGLSPFGRQVVAELNRLGMLADVSHISDDAVRAVLAVSTAPVIASHSSARVLADAPRNLPDDLIRAIGEKGGVVMVNFYPAFLSGAWRAWDTARTARAAELGVPGDLYGERAPATLAAWDREHPEPEVTVTTVADHVEHIARVAGRQALGLGGDFDGIGGTSPRGMTGVDAYPALLAELARRGWSDDELAGIAGANVLRVMERAEAAARALADRPAGDGVEPLVRP